jgi:ATP-dependent DNA helicase DinG
MKDIFSANGYLSSIIPSFEFRDEQLRMAEFLLERLYDSENGIIEAGTGTGKTLAYLLPTVLYALEQDKKIAVTTETKTLQKQLVDKDLPIVQEVIKKYYNMELSFSLCLGSSNYPCRKRFEAALKSGKLHPGELKKLKPVGRLFGENKIFTHFDTATPGYLWNEINREGDSCDSYKCPYAAVCSYQLSRKEWGRSNLLVMNHYLFFTNIASGKTYLPPCEIVIFDEAHSLEDIAASQIGFNIGYREILDIINLFYNEKKYNIANSIKDESIRMQWITAIKKIMPEISGFFEGLRTLVPTEKNYTRLKEPLTSGNVPVELLKNFMVLLAEAENIFDEENPRRIEFDIARGKLFTCIENLSSFVNQTSEKYVYWIEREANALLGDLFLRGQPVEISELFQREIITCYDSSLFVSATLSIGGDFSYIAGRLGIENFKALSLQSSFDYQSQVILYIDPEISDPGKESYNSQAAADAAEIINHVQGNCLMLFTSYKTLRDVKNILGGMIDYPVYSQDVLASTDAFERYVGDTNSVLMGTHSFWQGIDLPGDLVRGVILMKLPFAVPDSPPVEAKMERIAAMGKNPFASLQVPEAVIRFKQGFGRLIRSSTDRGIVAVLDSRIVNKPYGKIFLKAIPECRIVHSLTELKDAYSLLGCKN